MILIQTEIAFGRLIAAHWTYCIEVAIAQVHGKLIGLNYHKKQRPRLIGMIKNNRL
jgi:hypothetical protein